MDANAYGSPTRRYHFHFPGVMYVAVTLFVALGAINSQNNLLFLALGLAMGGLLVSGILSGASLMGLRLERALPAHGLVGRPLVIRYTVANRNRLFPAFGLTITELAAGSGGRAATWPARLPPPRGFLAGVAAAGSGAVEVTVAPVSRGRADFLAVQVSTTFPFGLARKSVTFRVPQTTLILPAEVPLRPNVLGALAARALHGVGGERDPGMGDEFFGLREYVAGDSPRQIAWRRTARTGELVVRQNTVPTPLRLWVVLRASAGDSAVTVERSIALAAAVLRDAADQDVAVGLAVPALGTLHAPRMGRAHLERLLTELALLDQRELASSNQSGFPDPIARSGACVVVHAGGIDRSYGPRHAKHLEGDGLAGLVQPSVATERLLAMIDAAGAAPARRRFGWTSVRWLSGGRPRAAA